MIEEAPFHLLVPGRRPTGVAPVLLPAEPEGGPDWAGFAHLLGRIADTVLLPGVNLGPGAAGRIGHRLRLEVVATAGSGLGGAPFVAGVWAEDDGAGGFDPDRLAVEVQEVAARGGVPLLLSSPALAGLDPDGFLGLVAWMGEWCERLLVTEPAGAGLDTFGALMELGATIGVVRWGSRREVWERIEARDEGRGGFQVFDSDPEAIDQIQFGADHCLDLSAAVPDVVAARDLAWEAEDLDTLELQSSLQFLSSLVARGRAGSVDALARILRLRGWLGHTRGFGSSVRPVWEDELLRSALERLGI